MRARFALIAARQACELREVVLRDKPAALLAASPKGTVPVLVTIDGAVIDQSLDIMLWALRRHDPLGWLAPFPSPGAGNEAPGEGMALIAACDGDFKSQLDLYKYPHRDEGTSGTTAPRERCARFLSAWDQRLENGGHLLGARPSLADAALMPFVRQFSMVEPEWFANQPWGRLQAWLADWIASPLFSAAMTRQNPWMPGEPGVPFPPEPA